MVITPEFTWRLIQTLFWFSVTYTVFVNYLDCPAATPSAVLSQKGGENYWIPAICVGLICHWWWPSQ